MTQRTWFEKISLHLRDARDLLPWHKVKKIVYGLVRGRHSRCNGEQRPPHFELDVEEDRGPLIAQCFRCLWGNRRLN